MEDSDSQEQIPPDQQHYVRESDYNLVKKRLPPMYKSLASRTKEEIKHNMSELS